MEMESPDHNGERAPIPESMERFPESRSNSSPSTKYFSYKGPCSSSGGSGPSSLSTQSAPSTPEVPAYWLSPQFSSTEETHTKSMDSLKTSHSCSPGDGLRNISEYRGLDQRPHDLARRSLDEAPHEKSDDSTCWCWRHCSCSGEVPGDVAALCCCPLFLLSLLACLCFKCPKKFAFNTAKKVRNKTRRGQESEDGEEGGPELKRCTTNNGSIISSSNSSNSCPSPSDLKLKLDMSSGFEQQRSYFFPTPEPEIGVERPR